MDDINLPGALLGYRKNGQPIYLIAGGAPEDGEPGEETNPPVANEDTTYYTEADFQAAIAREREKLTGRISKTDERYKQLQAELKELQANDKKRQAEEEKRRKEAEAEIRKAREAEMSAKELIEQERNNWSSQFSELQTQMTQQQALMQKELELNRLEAYRSRRVAEERDEIEDELLDFVAGNSVEEIEQSIAVLKEKSARIFNNAKTHFTQARASVPGVGATGFTPQGGPLDNPADQQLTADDINAMDMDQYRELRRKMGIGANNSNKGLFG